MKIELKEWERVRLSGENARLLFKVKPYYLQQLTRKGILDLSFHGKDIFELKARNYVGVATLPTIDDENITIVIKPKVDIASLLMMLSHCSGFRTREVSEMAISARKLQTFDEFIKLALIRDFITCIKQALAWGFYSRIKTRITQGSIIKGHLLVSNTLSCIPKALSPVAVYMRWGRTMDCIENLLIKKACEKVLHEKVFWSLFDKRTAAINKMILNKCLSELWLVKDKPLREINIHRILKNIPLDRAFYMRKLILLSYLLCKFVYTGQDVRVPAIFLNMNTIFEDFIRGILNDIARTYGLFVKSWQELGRKFLFERPRSGELRPDIGICDSSGKLLSLIDVKYKKEVDVDDQSKMLIYLARWNLRCGALIYPSFNGKTRIEEFFTSLGSSKKKVFVVRLGIDNVASCLSDTEKFLKKLIAEEIGLSQA